MSAEPWFRFFASDWLSGTAGLSAAERGVYITIVAIIYDQGGPVTRDDARLARQCGLAKVSLAKIVDNLVALGKLNFDGQCLSNSRAEIELTDRETRIDNARKGADVTNGKSINKSKTESRSSARSSEIDVGAMAPAHDAPRAGAQQPQPQPHSPSENSSSSARAKLESECRKAVGSEPVLLDPTFASILELLEDGQITEGDVLTGVRAAMAEPNFRIRHWSQLVNWIRRAAKNRMGTVTKEAATGPPFPRPRELSFANIAAERIAELRQANGHQSHRQGPTTIDAEYHAADEGSGSIGADGKPP